MSDWKAIGGQVVAAGAPILGKIIGEFIPFPGGGMLAEWGIRKLVEALGLSTDATPAVIANTIQNTPPDVLQAKLAAAEKEADAKWEAYARAAEAVAEVQKTSAAAINETQRTE